MDKEFDKEVRMVKRCPRCRHLTLTADSEGNLRCSNCGYEYKFSRFSKR
ncbi:hypothetical protein GF351_01745 [Candidatus Woesearchaeota archaeon]|nr:hypothetical protein [Candidatus Woesearchaeota archaeon]